MLSEAIAELIAARGVHRNRKAYLIFVKRAKEKLDTLLNKEEQTQYKPNDGKYIVEYREEFTAVAEAESPKEAIERFKNGDLDIIPATDLHDEYFMVKEKDTEKRVL